ncbi:MAG: T9SS type A sorting domain-containing protein [Bacteroidota bacterium]
MNLVQNTGGTGTNFAQRIAGTPSTGSINNYNILWAGTFTNNFIMGGFITNTNTLYGTTGMKYNARIDINSAHINPGIVNPTGDLATLNMTLPNVNPAAQHGDPNLADPVLVDFAGNLRSNRTPVDIGAYASANDTLSVDSIGPELTVPVLSNTASVGNRTFTATLLDRRSGVAGGLQSPRVYFNKNGGAYQFTTGTLLSGDYRNGTWEFTIDYTLLSGVVPNDIIRYYVIAQDSVLIVNSNPAGAVATAVDTVLFAPLFPNLYTITNPIPTSVTVGPTGNYPSLTGTGGFFAAVNNSLLQGNTTVLLESGTITETGTNALNQWLEYNTGTGVVGNFGYTLTIRPGTNTQTTLTGTVSIGDGMIRINGADRVSILGYSPSGTVADTNLVIRNISTSQPCLTYLNDATNNNIQNVVFETANTGTGVTSGGAVRISQTSIATGNDNISMTGSHLRWLGTGGLAGILFAASGTTGVNRENDNLLIENCTFYNFNFNAIQISTGTGNNQVIKNNRFFQSPGAFHTTSPTVINFIPGGLSNNDTISGNIIGGATFVLDTSNWYPSITSSLTFTGIGVSAGAVTGTYIANNRIANIHHAFRLGTNFASTFTGIQVNSGGGVAYIINNYIGDTIQPDNILHSGNTTTLPISCQTGSNSFINNNIVANITNNNPNGTSVAINGIRAWNQTATLQINNNTIINLKDSSASTTSTTSAAMIGINISSNTNSIQVNGNFVSNLANNSLTPAATSQVLGIYSSSGLPNITNNTVEKLLSRSLNTSTSTGATLIGIWSQSFTPGQTISNNIVRDLLYSNPSPAATQLVGIMQSSGSGHTIRNNQVYNLKSNSSSSNTAAAASIIGIMHNGSGTTINILGNRIYNLENLNTSSVLSNIVGIMMQNTTTAVYSNISRNFIHSFKANSTSTARLVGIQQNSGSFVRYTNNMIRLGIDSSGTSFSGPYEVNGILTELAGNFDYFHNSIYIGGAPSSGSSITAAIRLLGTPTGTQNYDIRNNILVNAVSNTGTAIGKNYGLRITGIPTNPASIVSNYNIYHVTGTGGFIAGTNLVDYPNLTLINGWKALTGYDLQSGSGNPQFVDATGTADLVDLHLQPSNPVESSADASISSIVTEDFDGQLRSTQTAHDIGADAGNFVLSADLIAPVITFTPLSNQGNLTGPVPLTNVNIRDNGGVFLTGNTPRLYYRKGSAGIYSSVGPVSQTGSPTNATFSFDLDYSLVSGVITGDTIFYYVIAEDSIGSNIMSSAPYAVASNVNTVAQHPLLPNSYSLLPVIPAGTKFYVGIGQPYTTLTGVGGLFEFLNNSTIGGSITAVITSNINEPGTVQLSQIGEDGPGSGSFTFTIRPDSSAVTPRVLAGAVGTLGMVVLNGADRVKITGVPDQSVNNTLRNLTLRNSNGPVVNFVNGAQQCRLNNLLLESGNGTGFNAVNQGVVSFAGTNNSFGNNQDSVTNCIIRNNTSVALPQGVPQILVGSYHTGLILNTNNVISGNEMSNASSVYVNVEIGSGNGWIVSNNSMFNTLTTLSTIPLPIRFNGGILSEGHTITNNTIGGTAPNAGGAPWTTNVFAAWNQIQLAVGLNQVTHVTGNIIRNISWPQTGSANQWNGIIATSGRLNISNNMFGDSTTSGSISLSAPTTHNGIVINATVTSPVSISGNRFAGLSFISTGNSIAFNAISIAGGITTVSNNIIGATGVSNSILHDGNSTLRGIVITNPINIDPSTQVINNTIANMTSVAAVPSASVGGIQQTGTTVSNISGNRIFNLSSQAANSSLSATGSSVFGIGVSATVNPGMLIANNLIYNISAANTDPIVTNSFGIAVQSTNSMVVAGNRIYDIRNLSTAVAQNPTSVAAGITVFGMQNKIDIYNNQITLGNAQSNNIQYNGIWQNTSGGFDVNCYYNSVLITGTSGAGSIPSFAYHRGSNSTGEVTSTTRLFNNAFINNRAGGSSKHYAIANEVAGTPTGSGWQESGYNLLSSSSATTVGLWGASDRDIAQWRTSSNADRTSWSVASATVNPSALFTDIANGNLNVATTVPQNWYLNGKGIAGSTSFNINTDFSGNARGTTLGFGTDIGAHEFTSTSTPPAMTLSGSIAYGTTNTLSFASRDIATITWGGLGTLPSAITAQYFSATTPPNSFPAARHLNAYMTVSATGGTGYVYHMTVNYDPALLGNVLSQTDLKVARNATGTWSVDNTSTANTVARTVTTGTPFNGFGTFTATDATSPLPVQLLSFEGAAVANDVVLKWTTASELNSELFDVERSADALNFEFAGSVAARGNSNVRIDYVYTDADALATQPILYYRLKQLDKDGTFTYSNTVQVSKLASNSSAVTVYPNPFEGNLNIAVQSTQAGIAHASIVDLQGRTVMTFDRSIQEGLNVMPIDASKHLQKGVYFIRIELNGEVTTTKVVNVR